MKKEIVAMSLATIFLVFLTAAVTGEKKLANDGKFIDMKVYSALENREQIEVFVKTKGKLTQDKDLTIFRGKNAKEHFNKNYVSMVVSRDELDALIEMNDVEEIYLERYLQANLWDSTTIINATGSWQLKEDNLNLTGAGQTICIIDTGVNYTHQDLGGCFGGNNQSSSCKIKGGVDWCADNGATNCSDIDSFPEDLNGHGTHVAGIASANGTIKGVAPDSNLIIFKAGNASGSFRASDVLDGIEWCTNYSSFFNISVISMSLGGGANSSYCDQDIPEITDAINQAVFANISVVVSTGNDGNSNGVSFPACITNSTRVGASDKSDGFWTTSNRNPTLLIVAPGVSINSTSTDQIYETMSGTSMATPHVSGAIAILRQYLTLTNQRKTPYQIEDVLNDTGRALFDGASIRNYSRINIRAALVALDIDYANVSLVSPSTGYLHSSGNLTFRCNASDLSIRNASLYLWNSTNSIINISSRNITGQNAVYEVNLSLSASGDYRWNCLFGDENGNSAFALSNNTFAIGDVILTLTSPANNTYSNVSNTNFTCTGQSSSLSNLTNMTFYLWNSSSLVYSRTQNSTGNTNLSVFNYTFVNSYSYLWNCRAVNNASNISTFGSNYTFTFDSIKPNLSIISPDDGYSTESNLASIDFYYNSSDNLNLSNCTLNLNGLNETNSSIINNASLSQKITSSLTPGTYSWQIICSDYALNQNISETRSLTINTPTESNGGGGGSRGGSPPSKSNFISETQLQEGYTKSVKKGDKYRFNLSGQEHNLIVNSLNNNSVNLTIRSNEINLTLLIGETRKLSLTREDIYDISVTLLSINKSGANLIIKKLSEKVPTEGYNPILHTANSTENKDDSNIIGNDPIMGKESKFIYIIISAIVIAILIVFVFLRYKTKKDTYRHSDKVHYIKYNVEKDKFY